MDASSVANMFGWPAIAGFVGIVFVIIILTLLRKVSSKSRGAEGISSTGLNLIELKKKGLLTPEELERVGNSLVRQMEKTEEMRRRKSNAPATDRLLLDPEVRRLEVLAAAGKKKDANSSVSEARRPVENNNVSTKSQPDGPAAVERAGFSAQELAAVELPLDVQQMVDAGLLMPDEVDKIKERLLNRKLAGPPAP